MWLAAQPLLHSSMYSTRTVVVLQLKLSLVVAHRLPLSVVAGPFERAPAPIRRRPCSCARSERATMGLAPARPTAGCEAAAAASWQRAGPSRSASSCERDLVVPTPCAQPSTSPSGEARCCCASDAATWARARSAPQVDAGRRSWTPAFPGHVMLQTTGSFGGGLRFHHRRFRHPHKTLRSARGSGPFRAGIRLQASGSAPADGTRTRADGQYREIALPHDDNTSSHGSSARQRSL